MTDKSNRAPEPTDAPAHRTSTAHNSADTSSSGSDNSAASTPTNAEKDPDEWVTGDESMTGPQASYLRTLCQEAGEEFDETLTKAQASKRIEELQSQTGRGVDH